MVQSFLLASIYIYILLELTWCLVEMLLICDAFVFGLAVEVSRRERDCFLDYCRHDGPRLGHVEFPPL